MRLILRGLKNTAAGIFWMLFVTVALTFAVLCGVGAALFLRWLGRATGLITLALLLTALAPAAGQEQRRPLRPRQQPTVSGPVSPDGTPVLIDVPVELRLRNRGGSDGAGLCVTSSIEVAGRFQGSTGIVGLQQRRAATPGGDNPPSVDAVMATLAPGVRYLQAVDADPAFIQACLQAGYCVCSSVMGGEHMVNLVHLDSRWACILDNNSPYETAPDGTKRDTRLIWKSAAAYLRDSNNWGSGTWIVVVLEKGPPPPIPTNALDSGTWTAPAYEWWHDSAYAGDLYLYRDGRLVGGWTRRHDPRGAFYPKIAGRWQPAAVPPVPVPAPPSVYEVGACRVATARANGCRPCATFRKGYSVNGKTIDRAVALQLVTKGAALPRLTVIGDDAFRKAVLADLAGPLKWWAARLIIQAYDPAHPLAAGVGLTPGITLQPPPDAGGKAPVLFRFRAYAGPAKLAEALRQKAPGYDPARDPDPMATPPAPEPVPAPQPEPAPVAITAADWLSYAPFGVLSALLVAVTLIPGRRSQAAPPTPNLLQELLPWTRPPSAL